MEQPALRLELAVKNIPPRYNAWMDTIRTKRWNDPSDADDGVRILICRFRPRGVRKADETWDKWLPNLGPSADLHAAVYGKRGLPLQWDSYRIAYLREMRSQQPAIAELAEQVRSGQTITLLCSSSCDRESRCHRSLLKTLIEQEISRSAAKNDS